MATTNDPAVASLTLLNPRSMRLDIHPFLILHAVAVLYAFSAVHDAAANDWQRALAMLLPAVTFIAHGILLLATFWSLSFYATIRMAPASSLDTAQFVLVKPVSALESKPALCALQKHQSPIRFEAVKQMYMLNSDGVFERLRYPYENANLQTLLAAQGVKSHAAAEALRETYQENKVDIPLPEIRDLLVEQFLSPFFVFQTFCVVLWLLDDYWYFALLTLAMLVLFEYITSLNRRRNVQVARSMLRPPHVVYCKRGGQFERISTWELVPGDVFSLVPGEDPVPCDALLLCGSVFVNEAVLTGESTPKAKEAPAPADVVAEGVLPTRLEESRHVVLEGTVVLQRDVSAVDGKALAPDCGCCALVLRTGFGTTSGSLMRKIVHASERVTVDNTEVYAFMLILVVIACVASGYVLRVGLEDAARSRWKLFLHCIMVVTSVVPPELPMELSLAVTTSLSALIKKHIYCTEPYRIPLAGAIDVCCFDKTGTLTSDELRVQAVVGANGNVAAEGPSADALRVMGACHELALIAGDVRGSPSELAAFARSGFTLASTTRCVAGDGTMTTVIRRFAFSSELRRMSVVADRSGGGFEVLCKGAPEALRPLLAAVPDGYDDAANAAMGAGARVLCLAHKALPASKTREACAKLTRAEAECALEFDGLLCLENPLKPGTHEAVAALLRSGHRVVVITGDNALTAVAVAKRAGIPRADHYITGDELDATADAASVLVRDKAVFARVSPVQKERVIRLLKAQGLRTLMCGDGTNDVGALKCADVGVSIVSKGGVDEHPQRADDGGEAAQVRLGDASIASPFTAKMSSIRAVLDVVRQGRCTLVTTVQMFKILASNGLLHSMSMTVLYLRGVKQGEFQSTVAGLLVAFIFALLSFTQPLEHIATRRPVARIFCAPVLFSIAGQSLTHLIFLYNAAGLGEPAALPVNPDDDFKPNEVNTLVYIAGLACQANIFAVNYRGHPFMLGLVDNRPLFGLLLTAWGLALVLAMNVLPGILTGLLELVSVPSATTLVSWLLLDTAVAWTWELVVVRWALGG